MSKLSALKSDPIVYNLVTAGLSLECEPQLPFDVATFSIQTREVEGKIVSEEKRVTLLSKTHERHNDIVRTALEAQDATFGPKPTVNAGLLQIVERELLQRGLSVTVQSPPRHPEKFRSRSNSAISSFVAENNSGVIRYGNGLSRLDVIQEIERSFPDVTLTIVAPNEQGATSIAKAIPGRFHVPGQFRSFTEEQVSSRVLVGTVSPLEQKNLRADLRDLIILTDPLLCNHEKCENLLHNPYASPRLFVLQQDSEPVHPKSSDRVVQFVGVNTLTVGPHNRRKCSVSVSYLEVNSGAVSPSQDEVSLVRRLEASKKRNEAISKIARKVAHDNTGSMTLLLCVGESHARLLAQQLGGWVYVNSQMAEEHLANRAVRNVGSVASSNNIICTTASLKALQSLDTFLQNRTNLTIVWAGLRSAPFDLPERLLWRASDTVRTIEVVDIQDKIFVGGSRNPVKADHPTTKARRQTEFDARLCVSDWNDSRRQECEGRGWGRAGRDTALARLDAACKRLVVQL